MLYSKLTLVLIIALIFSPGLVYSLGAFNVNTNQSLVYIKQAFGYAWDLSNPCELAGITCTADGSDVIDLELLSPSSKINPPMLGFDLLESLSLSANITLGEHFWDLSIDQCPKLQTLKIYEPVTNMSQIEWNAFPQTLNYLLMTPLVALPTELFIFTNITEMVLYSSSSGLQLPTLNQSSPLQSLTIFNIKSTDQFFSDLGLGYFKNLSILTLNNPLQWNWNSFDKISNLTFLNFKYDSSVTTSIPIQQYPSSLASCKNLQSIEMDSGTFLPFQLIDLSGLTSSSFVLAISASLLTKLQYPGIIIPSLASSTLHVVPDPSLTTLDQIDFTPFTQIIAINLSLTTSLPDNNAFYVSPKRIELNNNNATGVAGNSFCYASYTYLSLANNLFSDIPNCFKCQMVLTKNVFYPSTTLPPYATNYNCSTFSMQSTFPTSTIPTAGGYFEINGIDMGWNYVLEFNGQTQEYLMDIPNHYSKITIPPGVGADNPAVLYFHSGEYNSTSVSYVIMYTPPLISNYSISSNGQSITINGINFGTSLSYVSALLTYDNINLPLATFNVYQISLAYTPPSSTFTAISLIVGGQSTVFVVDTLKRAPNLNNALQVLDVKGGSTQITGDSFAVDPSLFNMTIDGRQCTITGSTIGSVNYTYPPFTSYGLKTLVLNVIDGNKILYQTGTSVYFPQPIQPCVPTAHGTCNANNTLVCNQGWTGNDCNSQIIVVNPSKNDDAPTTSINSTTTLSNGEDVKFSSLISIVEVREYNGITGEPVKYYPINKWFVETVSSNEYKYSTNISKDGSSNTTILVDIKYFPSEETIQFANESITMNPSTIKYQIELSPYQFSTSYNRLMIVMSAQLDRSESDTTCSSVQNGQDQTSLDYDYLKLQINEISLYSKFIKFGIIDQRKSYISNTFLNSTQQSNQIISLVGINVPYYLNSVILDPDFSVLIDSNSVTDTDSDSVCSSLSSSSKKLTKEQLAGIIIGSVAGFIIISLIIGLILYKKFRYSSTVLNIKDKMTFKMKKRKEGTNAPKRSTAPLYTGGKIKNIDAF